MYPSQVPVTVACSTPGAVLRYTTDGSEPDENDASVTSGSAITLDRAQILKVKAWAPGLDPSAVVRADYVITGSVSAGGGHVLVLRGDGTVWAYGDNSSGQLGNGTTTSSSVPVQVPGLTDVVAVAAGYQHSLALTRTGAVWAWGDNTHGQLGSDPSITQVFGAFTQLGLALDHHPTGVRSTPAAVPVVDAAGAPLDAVVAVSAGDYHSLALRNDLGDAAAQSVWGWGDSTTGSLGNADEIGAARV